MVHYFLTFSPPPSRETICSDFDEILKKLASTKSKKIVLHALVREYGSKQSHEHRHAVIESERRTDSIRRMIVNKMKQKYFDFAECHNSFHIQTVWSLPHLYRAYLSKEVSPENPPLIDNDLFKQCREGAVPGRTFKKLSGEQLVDMLLEAVKYRDQLITPYVFNKIVSQFSKDYYLVPLRSQMEYIFRQVQAYHSQLVSHDENIVTEWVKM